MDGEIQRTLEELVLLVPVGMDIHSYHGSSDTNCRGIQRQLNVSGNMKMRLTVKITVLEPNFAVASRLALSGVCTPTFTLSKSNVVAQSR